MNEGNWVPAQRPCEIGLQWPARLRFLWRPGARMRGMGYDNEGSCKFDATAATPHKPPKKEKKIVPTHRTAMRQYHGAAGNNRRMTTLSTTTSRCRRCQTGTQHCAVYRTNCRRKPKIKVLLTQRTAMRQYHGAAYNSRGMTEASTTARRCRRREPGTQDCKATPNAPAGRCLCSHPAFLSSRDSNILRTCTGSTKLKELTYGNVSATDSSPQLTSPKHTKLLAHTSPRAPTNPGRQHGVVSSCRKPPTGANELHRWPQIFIHFILGGSRNVVFYQRQGRSVWSRSRNFSGRNSRPTASDSLPTAPSPDPRLWCQLA